MNKIKAVYDLTRAIQRRESKNGTIMVELKEGFDKVGSLEADFDMNKETGRGKVSHKLETTLNGGAKHAGEVEFSLENCHNHHHKMMGKMHSHTGRESVMIHRGHHKGCGHLSKLSFGLAILDSLQVEEKADGSRSYILDMKNPSEALAEMIGEKCNHGAFQGEEGEGCCEGNHGNENCCFEDHGMKSFLHGLMKMEEKEGKLVIETDRIGTPTWVRIDAAGKTAGQPNKTVMAEIKLV